MVKIALTLSGITEVVAAIARRYETFQKARQFFAKFLPFPEMPRTKIKLLDLVQGREFSYRVFGNFCRVLGLDAVSLLASGVRARCEREQTLAKIPETHRQLIEQALTYATLEQKKALIEKAVVVLESGRNRVYSPTKHDVTARQKAYSELTYTSLDATGLVVAALPLLPFSRQRTIHRLITGYRLKSPCPYAFTSLIRPSEDTYAWLTSVIESAFGSRNSYVRYLSGLETNAKLSVRTANRIVYDLRLKHAARLNEWTYFSWETFSRYLRPLEVSPVKVCLRGVRTKLQGEPKYRLSETKYFLQRMARFSTLSLPLRQKILAECVTALNRAPLS